MKKIPHALTMALIVLTSPLTFASSTDLTVTGLITPNACTPTLSGGGIVDHGKLSAKDLKQDQATSLGSETLQLTVNCDAATEFRLLPTDNKSGTSYNNSDFGLGFINVDQKLGSVTVRIQNPIADGVAVQPLVSTTNGSTWFAGRLVEPNLLSAFGAVGGPATPIAIKDLQTDLRVLTRIARADSLDLTNEVALDGSATLSIVYP
jgi:hypothetical protein